MLPTVPGRALLFGRAAEAYERFRPEYPDDIVDLVLTYASRPLRTAVEIGAGTGKATRLFAHRGVEVTATEPDEAMLVELRKRLPEVQTVRAAFEDLTPPAGFELVYSAAALHWTLPEGRWSSVAALLGLEGVFANFGGPLRLVDPSVERAVEAARAPFLASDEVPSPDGTPRSCGGASAFTDASRQRSVRSSGGSLPRGRARVCRCVRSSNGAHTVRRWAKLPKPCQPPCPSRVEPLVCSESTPPPTSLTSRCTGPHASPALLLPCSSSIHPTNSRRPCRQCSRGAALTAACHPDSAEDHERDRPNIRGGRSLEAGGHLPPVSWLAGRPCRSASAGRQCLEHDVGVVPRGRLGPPLVDEER